MVANKIPNLVDWVRFLDTLPRKEGTGMNSLEFQTIVQYLEAIRLEQKKTSDILTGVGMLILILGMLLLFWKL